MNILILKIKKKVFILKATHRGNHDDTDLFYYSYKYT